MRWSGTGYWYWRNESDDILTVEITVTNQVHDPDSSSSSSAFIYYNEECDDNSTSMIMKVTGTYASASTKNTTLSVEPGYGFMWVNQSNARTWVTMQIIEE